MKTYTALFAIDVPHYCKHVIEAENDEAAIAAAGPLYNTLGVPCYDPEWDYAGVARIVHIEDPDGNMIVEDYSLDDYFIRYGGEAGRLLCDSAADMLEAIGTLISKADDLISAIDGTTGQFEAEVAALSAAASDAEKVALKARGQS